MRKKWIKNTGIYTSKGYLHKTLGISRGKRIPKTLLETIVKRGSGVVIVNPTKIGRKKIKVTQRLDKKANLVLNLKNLR